MSDNNSNESSVRSLTQEQIDWLKSCPHVVSFSGKKIFWSKKILDKFSEEYDKGEQAKAILERLDINLDILGKSRIAIFRNYYSETWRPAHYNLPPNMPHGKYEKNLAHEIDSKETKFHHRLKYLEQEVEFLKKIFTAEHRHTAKPVQPRNTK